MSLTTSAQRDTMWTYIERTGAQTDQITYPQLFAAAGLAKLSNAQYAPVAAELLNYDAATLKANTKRLSSGTVILGHRTREDRQIPVEALARFDKSIHEPPEPDTGIAPYTNTPRLTEGAAQRLVPFRLPRVDDFDAKTASTSLTAGGRLESVRKHMGVHASSADERIARLEATQEALLLAVEKINETLRKYRDAFNNHVDVLDITQEAVSILQHNVGILHHDISGLYGQ